MSNVLKRYLMMKLFYPECKFYFTLEKSNDVDQYII